MAHGISSTDSMVSLNGVVPWHFEDTKGQTRVIDGHDYTAAQVVEKGGIGWRVRKDPLFLADGTPVPSSVVLVREDNGAQLNVVGEGVEVLQNVEMVDVAAEFVSQKFGTFETAGSLWGGRTVWCAIRLVDSFEVIPGDPVETYVTLSNAHGMGSVEANQSCTRVVCNNTLKLSRETGRLLWKIRHTKGMRRTLEQSKNDYATALKRARYTRQLYKAMAAKRIDHSGLIDYIKDCLAPVRASDAQTDSDSVLDMLGGVEAIQGRAKSAAEARREATIERICELAEMGRGTNVAGVRGSLWGAYNAVTEYASHEYPVRGGGSREQSIYSGAAGELLDRAIDAATARVSM